MPLMRYLQVGTVVVCAAAGAGCDPVALLSAVTLPEEVLAYTPAASSDVVPDDSIVDESRPEAPPEGQYSHSEAEPNDTWADAEIVSWAGSLQITGAITAGTKDVDFFELGPASADDRLQASLGIRWGLDVELGLFDSAGRILAYIDPNSATAGPGTIDIILHDSTNRLYAMVASRGAWSEDLDYTVDVSLQRGAGTASPHSQTVVLVFSGASGVRIGSRAPVDVPPFDIGTINADFAGQTDALINRLMEMVREDYDGLDVTFYRNTDPGIPAGGQTRIYFGTSDTRLLGLADNIDPYNGDSEQSAILYTDTFSVFNQLHPDFEATAQVFANVTSHEAGHLLGLRHTADVEDLMDVTASARKMMLDQWFKIAPLDSSVLPLGVQDAPTMLSWGVGGELIVLDAGKTAVQRRAADIAPAELDFYIPRSMLADCSCHVHKDE